jgi:hypothetical protein
MANRDVNYLKPRGRKDYLTLAEMSRRVSRDPSWLRHLEREGRIPKAARVKRGAIEVRLWSPAQAVEIERIISQHRPGRPTNA